MGGDEEGGRHEKGGHEGWSEEGSDEEGNEEGQGDRGGVRAKHRGRPLWILCRARPGFFRGWGRRTAWASSFVYSLACFGGMRLLGERRLSASSGRPGQHWP